MSKWSHIIVPFDFSQLRGNHPGEPITINPDACVAKEDGAQASDSPLANFIAGVMLTVLVLLFATLTGDLREGVSASSSGQALEASRLMGS